jgi:sulfate-transporting ATPase
VGIDSLIVLGIAAAVTAALSAIYRYTRPGLAMRTTAHAERLASLFGWSPDALALVSWVGGAILTTSGIIILASFSGVSPVSTPLVIFPMLATALFGGFMSFPLTFVGGLLIGISQSLMAGYVDFAGAPDSVPLLAIIALLMFRRKGVRLAPSERLPSLGSGRVRWPVAISGFLAVGVLIVAVLPVTIIISLTTSLAWATIMLSIVVLLGYTGQLSFEQIAMAGIAALVAGRLTTIGVPFILALLIAVVAAVPTGLIFAIPALRTRGINLAIVTLGLSITVSALLFQNSTIIGATNGTPILHTQRLLGLSLDPIHFPERYCEFVLVFFGVVALGVANVRRGIAGRRLIAVRTNEQAASALGISVFGAKLYAFALGSTVAAIGGVLLAFQNAEIVYDFYNPVNSALAVGWTVIGGVGYVIGPMFAGPFPPGGLGNWLANELWTNGIYWLTFIGGLALMLILLQDPDGLASMNVKALAAGKSDEKLSRLAYLRLEVLIIRGLSLGRARFLRARPTVQRPPLQPHRSVRVPPMRLEVNGLSIVYGGVTAVNGVSLAVEPGEILGLIGPNGAGKTSVINAVSGFVRPARGEVFLGGAPISRWSADRRARSGLIRTFQSLELFESSTVRENLLVAGERRDFRPYVSDLVLPREPPLSDLAVASVYEFQLQNHLDAVVQDLPYGVRHLVSIARAVAATPSVLLLDEPAAGLSTQETEELVHAVLRLANEYGMGILVVEHDMTFVMNACDRIIVLDFGNQIAEGRPREIRNNPVVVRAYLGGESDAEPGMTTAHTQ